ncbi:MAG: hypothetical protein PSN04_05965 [Methyloprofundus sp.]|nr:hypothetical protein [Methyloprofundus sp.]
MDIERTAQVSPVLSAQRTANTHEMKAVKMANEHIEAEGQAALMLIQSVPAATELAGNNINVTA